MRTSHALFALCVLLSASQAHGQWVTTHEQTYLPASHNWQFRKRYPAADRLFNAFDYGHAILYEELYRRPGAPASRLERDEFEHLTTRVLAAAPRLPLEEGAIEVAYARLVPEAKLMFEWAHVLHRQVYDVLADERLSDAQRDAAVATLLRYYRSRPDLAFSSRPKSMELMEGQPYSLAFRRKYPKFNGLIWAYHWMQVGLYDALLGGTDSHARQSNVNAAVSRFWQMLGDAPERMPRLMPMTAAVAPRFAERYPEAAIIFDNLHGMHDVISDVLASPLVPRAQKRERILEAARRYRDDSSFVMTVAEWRDMSRHMGVENMGGVAAGFLPALPTPTVPIGASHADAMKQRTHQGHGETATPAPTPHAGHDSSAAPAATKPTPDPHAAHTPAAAPARAAQPAKRAATKTTTRPTTRPTTARKQPAKATKQAGAKPAPKPAPKPDPHAGHGKP